MLNDITVYQQEQDKVLETFLNQIYSTWDPKFQRQHTHYGENDNNNIFLELIVTPNCNQKCEYCYYTRHRDELYPADIRDEKLILNNLKILCDYFEKKQLEIPGIHLFSGEIWHTDFGDAVLQILLSYLVRKQGFKIGYICIPTNFSFCFSQERMKKMAQWITAFSEVGVNFMLSCSIDGLVVDNENRPLNTDKEKLNEFYSNVYSFCKRFHFGYHPMISANSIELQPQNYDAWLESLAPFYDNDPHKYFDLLMQLEVRNDDWTEEKIISYCKWLNHYIEKDKEVFFNNDLRQLRDWVLFHKTDFPRTFSGYNPCIMVLGNTSDHGRASCTIGTMLPVRLGDLAIVPCHRTSYDKFLLGRFRTENDEIVGVEAKNLSVLNSTYRTHYGHKPLCDTCAWEPMCIRGCLGSQYESTGELHFPIQAVCNLEQAKITFLFEKYISLGFFDCNQYPDEIVIKPLLDFYLEIKDTKEYQKWATIIRKNILQNS